MTRLAETYDEHDQRRAVADALRCLTTSGVKVPVRREDLASMVETWLASLRDVHPDVIRETGLRLAGEATEFPTLADFRGAVGAERKRSKGMSPVCALCDGTTWISPEGDTFGPSSVVACPECAPDRAEWIQNGHSEVGHDSDRCTHPLCERKIYRGRKKS